MSKTPKNKRIFKIGAALIVFLLACVSIFVYANQDVRIGVKQTKDVQIVLAKGDSPLDLTNYETDLRTRLSNKGVDTSKVSFQQIDTSVISTSDTSAATIFNTWEQFPVAADVGNSSWYKANWRLNASNGTIYTTSDVNCTGFWDANSVNDKDYRIEFDVYSGDTAPSDPYSFFFRMARRTNNRNNYSFYAVTFFGGGNLKRESYTGDTPQIGLTKITSWIPSSSDGNHAGPIWAWDYNFSKMGIGVNNLGNTTATGKHLKTVYNPPMSILNAWVHCKIEVYGNNIKVYINNSSTPIIDYTDTDNPFLSGGYGPAVTSNPSVTYKNVSINKVNYKSVDDLLKEITWKDDSLKFVINADNSNSTLNTETVSRILNQGVYYEGVGNSNNAANINRIIAQNDNKGIYVNDSNYSNFIENTAQYIKQIIGENENNTDYVIVNEPTTVTLTSPVTGVTTPTNDFPNGVWKVEHDYNYYENPQSQYSKDGMYTNNLINSFDNVGKYSIYCEDQLVKEVYAHRRPVSAFSMQLSGQNLTLKSSSKDLDVEVNASNYAQQKQNNGIANEKWEYKVASSANWTQISNSGIGNNVTVSLNPNTEYLVKLTVTDYQGETTSSTKYVTTGATSTKPVAQFNIVENPISIYKKLEVVNSSYDPSGASLSYQWTVIKNGTQVYQGSTPLLDYNSYGTGSYTMKLVVTNSRGTTSDAYTQNYIITPDTAVPELVIVPTTKQVVNEEIEIEFNMKDNESGLKSYKYAFTESTSPAAANQFTTETISEDKEATRTVSIPANQWDRHLYLHIIVEDNAGNKIAERVAGEYYIEPSYEVLLETKDSYDGAAIKGEKFNVIGVYEDNSTIELATNVETDKNGRIEIPKARLHKVEKIRIENIEAAEGYEKLSNKNIKIDTSSYSIAIDNSLTSNDVTTQLTNANRTMLIVLETEKSNFELKITNKDKDTDMFISGTVFVLKQNGNEVARGETVDGELILTTQIPVTNGTKDYVLEQESVNDLYNNIGNTSLKIEIKDGKFYKVSQKLFASNSAVEIPDSSIADIIVNNERKDPTTFSVNINVSDKDTGNNIQGSSYKVKVEGENDLNYTTDAIESDENGNIRIDGLFGTGLLRMTFIHESAPTGYALTNSSNYSYITIQRDADESITQNNASTIGVLDKIQDKVVYVKLTNENKETSNIIRVKIAQDDSDVGIPNVGLKVYKLMDNKLVGEGTTDSDGILEIKNVQNDGVGDVLYKLVADDNTVITKNFIFSITYDKNGNISDVQKVSTESNINVAADEEDTPTTYNYLALINFEMQQKDIDGQTKIIIENKSADDTGVEGIKYKITMKSDVIFTSPFTSVKTTNEDGIAQCNLPDEDTTMKIKIQQTKVPDGYRLDTNIKTVEIQKNDSGKWEIVSLDKLDESQVTIDENGNIVITENTESEENGNLKFQLATVNGTNTLALGGAEFEITEDSTGYTQTVTTNSYGYVSVSVPFSAQSARSYNFTITQTKAIKNYNLIENPINMVVDFRQDGALIVYDDIDFTSGDEYIQEKNTEYDSDTNEATVYIKIKNEKGNTISTGYDLDIIKYDSDGNDAQNSKYDIEIRPYAEESIRCDAKLISNSEIEVKDLNITEGVTTVLLKEVSPALGCDLDSDIKVITLQLDDDDNIIAVADTTSAYNVTVSVKTKNVDGVHKTVVEVVINAETPKGTGAGGGTGTGGDTGTPTDATECTVVFNTNGGTSVKKQVVNNGEKVTKPADPTYEEYGFLGWYADKDFTQAWDFDTDTVTSDITLYAKWNIQPAAVTFNLYNERLGKWDYDYVVTYYQTWQIPWYNRNAGYWYVYRGKDYTGYSDYYFYGSVYGNSIRITIPYYPNVGGYKDEQRYIRMFNLLGNTESYGFKKIYSPDITVEARLVDISTGLVDENIYETANAKILSSSEPTHNVKFYNDYANKTVEFTVIENIPDLNYKRTTNNTMFRVEFDEAGNIKSGMIVNGKDMEELAIPGISANGVVDNIARVKNDIVLSKTVYSRQPGASVNTTTYTHDHYEYDYHSVANYNCIGNNTINMVMLNKQIDNKLSTLVHLKDKDTDEGLNGPVSLVTYDITDPNNEKQIEGVKTANVVDGDVTISMENTYANRKLRFTLIQTSPATKDGLTYIDNSNNIITFTVETDDDGLINVNTMKNVILPDNAEHDKTSGTQVEYTIYNDIKYDFAINLTKLDENLNPLSGVRVRNTVSVIKNAASGDKVQVHTYGSPLTDENGQTLLKIVLPKVGDTAYYGRTLEIQLDEYYVPDNYRALTGNKIRILFDNSGNIAQTQVVQGAGEDILTITGEHNEANAISSIDAKLVNSRITEKPAIKITNVDSDDDTVTIEGTKYRIIVWDEDEYTNSSLNTDEEKYSAPTDAEGKTEVNFDNAHALRTMIYQLKEVETANSYETNKDIALKVTFDEEGRVAKAPEVINAETIKNIQGQNVQIASVEGNPIGSTTIQLKILNELKPKFTIYIRRENENKETKDNKEFRVAVKEKLSDGTYSNLLENRPSKVREDLSYHYLVGLKTPTESKTLLYTIYEETGNQLTKRGEYEITFDMYGNIVSGEIPSNLENKDNYIVDSIIEEGKNYIGTTIQAEELKIGIQVEDTTGSNYNLSGYSFEITNDKEEQNEPGRITNTSGSEIEFISDVYKGQTVKYTIAQKDAPIDYNDIQSFDVEVTYDDNGNILSCTPLKLDNVYDVVTTTKDSTTNMKLRVYTTPALRNSIQINLTDEDDNTILINNAEYEITTELGTYNAPIENGEGGTDIGSYKNYSYNKTATVTHKLKQIAVDNAYMINDKEIEIMVLYDNGIIQDANVISSDGYVQIDREKTIGTENLVLKTNNRRKTQMELEFVSTQNNSTKIPSAEFKIVEDGKDESLYADTQVTDLDGKATLYVGPYYRDTDVTYKITNTVKAKEFKQFEDATFTLHYDSNGHVTSKTIPSKFLDILQIDEINTDIGHIKMTLKADPLFTLGVTAISEVNGDWLAGGKYKIALEGSTEEDTIVTQAHNRAHAVVGENLTATIATYDIIELVAPTGYKYKDMNNVIGKIQVEFDSNGQIIPGNTIITQGGNYISLETPTDKSDKFDIDISIKYEEIDEFQVIIEDYDILNNTNKLTATFDGVLPNSTNTNAQDTTDSTTGIATLKFGKVGAINSTQVLDISQSNVTAGYANILPIRINVTFDESGKVINAQGVSGTGLATLNEAYTIEPINTNGQYVIKVIVKNNPASTIRITNISDGTTYAPVSSTLELSSTGINTISKNTNSSGQADFGLEFVPKDATANYTIKQTQVDQGYTLNKDINFDIEYDSIGRVKKVTPVTGGSYADSSVYDITNVSDYLVEITIKNKQVFEIYLETQDAYDDTIKLQNVSVNIEETTYSNLNMTLTTDANGIANAPLGSTFAGNTLNYVVSIINNIIGYSDDMTNITAIISVQFDNNGDIINISSNNNLVEATYKNGKAIDLTVKYIPILEMDVTRRNLATNELLSGKTIKLQSSILTSTVSKTTDSNGKIEDINAGKIIADGIVSYTITEDPATGYSALENIGQITIDVYYDAKGYISNVTTNKPDLVTWQGAGSRELSIEIGSNLKSTLSIVATDYNMSTTRITGKFEIKSDKGEITTIGSTTGTTNIIKDLGKIYPSETIKYTIHQTQAQYGYAAIPDAEFTVEYRSDGTIGNVTSSNTEYLEVKSINQTATQTTPNILLVTHNKAALLVNINVKDKTFNSGVEGLAFRIIDETTNIETKADVTTNENGQLNLSVPSGLSSTNRIYRIEEISTKGGYKAINPVRVVVEYDSLGSIVENGSYVIDNSDVTLTNGYSQALYNSSKVRGIQVNYKAETELGIGIVSKDTNDNLLQSIDYTIAVSDTDDNIIGGTRTTTNNNGEAVKYIGDVPTNTTLVYTISQVQPPKGYRNIKDIKIRINYGSKGEIKSYDVENKEELVGVNVEVATANLYTMTGSDNQKVHIKVTITNDNKFTFKLVNTENNNNLPIEGSTISMSVDDENGTNIANNENILTNHKGEAILANIEGNGKLRLYFNQVSVPNGYKEDTTNSGYIVINKSADIYNIKAEEFSNDLDYTIDNETGVIEIRIKNDNDLTINVLDVDSKTNLPVLGAGHSIISQVGEKTESNEDILAKTDNIKQYDNSSYVNNAGTTKMTLGTTYDFANKKVIYTIKTPTPAVDYDPIEDVHIVVEFDQYGKIETVNGISARLVLAQKDADDEYTIDAAIQFGNINFYKVKLVKESSYTSAGKDPIRINGAKFDVDFYLEGNKVDSKTDLVTDNKFINGIFAEKGLIEINELEYEGRLRLSLKETAAPDGYSSDILNGGIDVSFDVGLDKTDLENVKLSVNNVNSPNASVDVDSITREITIKVTNDPSIKLKINNMDLDGNYLGGMKFNLKVEDINTNEVKDYGKMTTDSMGIIETNIINNYADTSILLMLDVDKEDEYEQLQTIIIRAYVDKNGQIQPTSVEMTSGERTTDSSGNLTKGATIKDVKEHFIEIDVFNKPDEYVKKYSIKIVKVDADDESIVLPNVLFQIRITPQVGVTTYRVGTTNADGEIILNNLLGKENILIELKEVIAPEGYVLDESKDYFTYKINKKGDTLSKISSSEDDSSWEINDMNVKMKVSNQTDRIGIAIEKVDSLDKDITIQGAEFVLTDKSTSTQYTAITDSNGIANFKVDKQATDAKVMVQYELEETVAPEGYKLDNSIKTFYVQYENGEIKYVMEGEGLTKITEQNEYTKLQVENEQEASSLPKYNVKLINVDANDNTKVISDSEFAINIYQEQGTGHISKTKQTNSDGTVNVNSINGAGEIKITVENTKAAQEYKLNSNIGYVKLNRDAKTGTIDIKDKSNVLDVQYDAPTNTIIIKYTNEQLTNKFALKINLVDKETRELITDSNAQYNIDVNGNKKTESISSAGTLVINGLDIDDVSDFNIAITEEQGVEEYNTITEQELKVYVAALYGDRVLKNAEIVEGSNIEIVDVMSNSIEVNILLDKKGSPDNPPDEKLYLTSDVYRVTDDNVERVKPNTTIKEYLANMNSNGDMVVYDKNGNVVDETKLVGTGMRIVATKGNESITKEISVVGDLNGDGKITVTDLSVLNKIMVGKEKVTGVKEISADIDDNGKISVTDLSMMNQLLVGKYKVEKLK